MFGRFFLSLRLVYTVESDNCMKHILCLIWAMAILCVAVSCGKNKRLEKKVVEEDREAKAMLQGIWNDDDTDEPLYWIKGDSIFYADTTNVPVYFKVVGDTLITRGNEEVHYKIDRRTKALFWFHSLSDDIVKLHRSEDVNDSLAFQHSERPKIITYTDVVKRDSVFKWNTDRYHCYVAVNPTSKRVRLTTYNNDGMAVDNVYYDNIINICVYKGAARLYSKDFSKEDFNGLISTRFLKQAILTDMTIDGMDSKGCRFNATVCNPDGASCYMVRIRVGFDGRMSKELIEY